MKKIKLLLATVIVLIGSLGCDREDLTEDSSFLNDSAVNTERIKMVPFKGNFVSTPADVILIDCPDINPTGIVIPAPKINVVNGNATHLGILDDINSPLIVEECAFDSQTGFLTVTLNITLINRNGDGIRFLVVSNISLEGPASGNYNIVEGFGKFEGATGSLITEGFFNGETGVAEFSADGFVTQPNR